jgi:hypothetical protein
MYPLQEVSCAAISESKTSQKYEVRAKVLLPQIIKVYPLVSRCPKQGACKVVFDSGGAAPQPGL